MAVCDTAFIGYRETIQRAGAHNRPDNKLLNAREEVPTNTGTSMNRVAEIENAKRPQSGVPVVAHICTVGLAAGCTANHGVDLPLTPNAVCYLQQPRIVRDIVYIQVLSWGYAGRVHWYKTKVLSVFPLGFSATPCVLLSYNTRTLVYIQSFQTYYRYIFSLLLSTRFVRSFIVSNPR